VEDLTAVPDPVFWATALATIVPFVTALLVRVDARQWVKATVASALAVADAVLVSWKAASDAGAVLDWKTVVLAILGAVSWQRIVHSQVNVPYRVRERLLPRSGLR